MKIIKLTIYAQRILTAVIEFVMLFAFDVGVAEI